jgi:hypothetical protein
MKLTAGTLILLLIMNTVVSAVSVYIYDRYFAQKVVVIDIRNYMMDRKNMFLTGKISEKQFTESVDNIENTLQKTNKRTVVLLGDAVVRNAEKIHIED